MNKAIVTILSILLFISLISCSNSSKSDNNEIEIGITIYRYDDAFISFMRRNIETMLNGKAKFIMNDSENDQAKQNDQVDAAIQRNVNALAINLVDSTSASFMINKIKPTGIPVIFFNKEPSKEDMMLYDKAWYVGTLSEESGNIQGDIVVKSWQANPAWDKNGDGKIQYVLLKGEAGHPDAEARTERIKAVLNDNSIAIDQLDEYTANWDILQAQTAADSWIEKYGNSIEFIFSNNDAMALGALKSIQKQGYNIGDSNKFIPIVGVDAIPEIIEEIKKGTVVGTVLQSPKDQAKAVVDMVINAANGKDVLSGTEYKLDDVKAVRVPYRAITLENIDESAEAYK
ncbi:galactose ABC transporter substrate-binding protein [Brachyspira hampsonii]|uniref:D-galactose/methyl-galactoside binding periplasmic protein MglB n=1 Tax=Brachyspira hampsonii 30446 TaxID=1289135 RepID=A0A2U4EVN8_9SPIR|nr:galactose ABC transporter substrate-binding protein [Brachyspira hampsonii]EKV56916.1 galactose/glucose-binding protein [Brachyspira hampsonii 30446]MBW5390757.1 galactose/glucose ABC transporter substrate-binding protein MglB [Brachyspira hampsonii]MBW5394694.1 galactose/glucose ABC transporter substrate-binding protein MglB [Brachyspira hampsonii]OEJ18275.1 galactose ABC transporter substrate-binding protein [Brachyspira hampsonii]PTY40912.1 methyl-galactoside ABC transporter substrate-bi